ncbi:MAG: SDR family oxidoreductase [Hyphomicrobiales bacterium]
MPDITNGAARFAGRVALVTGAGSGIGRDCVRRFAGEGASVVAVDLEADPVAETLAPVEGPKLARPADVTRREAVDAAVAATLEAFGRLDILVTCAGIFDDTPFDRLTTRDWERVFAVNVTGTFNFCQAVIEPMRRQKWGRIVTLGSIGGKVGGPVSAANYAASKAAVMCLTKSAARYFAGTGVTVNSISPGVIETAMTNGWSDENRKRTIGAIPVGRLGMPGEVAAAVAFLASDDAAYITGEILDVNGGQLMD